MARRRGVERARERVASHPATVTIQSVAAIVGGLLAFLTLISIWRKRRRR